MADTRKTDDLAALMSSCGLVPLPSEPDEATVKLREQLRALGRLNRDGDWCGVNMSLNELQRHLDAMRLDRG